MACYSDRKQYITEPQISIIVPVYNVEKYIEKCFHSIEGQKFQDFECIFVDDYGNDNSMRLLEGLIANSVIREKCRIIHHEKNRGLSAARNSGLDCATGKYILFVDSDDYLLEKSLEYLTEPLKKEEADVIIGGYKRIVGDHTYLSSVSYESKDASVMEILYKFRGKLVFCVHNKLIKRRLLEENNIRFIEGILWEDNPFSMKYFNSLQKIIFLSEPTYAYVVRENSTCTTLSEKHYLSWYRCLDEMENIMKESRPENVNVNIRLLGSFRLRALIRTQKHGIRKQIDFLKYLRQKGYSEQEFQLLERKQKLLYIQHKMPLFFAGIYVVVFSFFYRLFREW